MRAESARGKVVAVMQPYFLPYAGYFRLFAAADEVVLLDNVQFPKHGYVHRNRFRLRDGRLDWLTLPLRRAPLSTPISGVSFLPDGEARLKARLRAFPLFDPPSRPADLLREATQDLAERSPADVIAQLLGACCAALSLPFQDLRAGALGLDPDLRGQDRVIAIAQARGADVYVNAPGGRSLYDLEAFAAAGMALRFLPPYVGPIDSIAQRLHDEDAATLRQGIVGQCALESP